MRNTLAEARGRRGQQKTMLGRDSGGLDALTSLRAIFGLNIRVLSPKICAGSRGWHLCEFERFIRSYEVEQVRTVFLVSCSILDQDMSSGSPTSAIDTPANIPKEEKKSMAKRLVGGSFSPSRTKGSQKLDDLDDTEAVEIFVNQEDEAGTDDEDANNIDLSVVQSVLGSTFKLDKDEGAKSSKPKAVVSFSGVDSPASSRGDDVKSNGELLAKIGRLEMKLKQAELDLSAEKARRKKSSRSTIKLAKEINKRTIEATAQQKAIEKVRMESYALTDD